MSNAQHTPGPWAERNGRIFAADRENLTIATVARSADGDYSPANGRLLAQAPNLLEALQRLSAQCTRLRLPGQPETDAERTARAVIAKVTVGAA